MRLIKKNIIFIMVVSFLFLIITYLVIYEKNIDSQASIDARLLTQEIEINQLTSIRDDLELILNSKLNGEPKTNITEQLNHLKQVHSKQAILIKFDDENTISFNNIHFIFKNNLLIKLSTINR